MTPAVREHIEICWGGRHKVAEVRRTHRRVLRVELKPSAQVIVFAPRGEEIQAVRSRVMRKCAWIFRQLDRIESRPAVTPTRHFVSGETHLVLGKAYRLAVEQCDTPEVRVDGDRLYIFTTQVEDQAECRRLLMEFYALRANTVFRERLEAMAPAFIRRGLKLPPLTIRWMTKRWGSYTRTGRIALNVDLVRASPALIDYVICHELTHGFYSDHGKDWQKLLSTVMPDWEIRKARLETLLR
jgi:predicted metal-dependent hydrolase